MIALFFDTETNGLPKNYKASYADLKNWPRVIQLAWQLIDCDTRQVIRQSCEMVKPVGWKLPTKEDFIRQGKTQEQAAKSARFWPDNGFTMEILQEKGKPIKELMQDLAVAMAEADILVAHNIEFDTPIVAAEMIRAAVKSGKRLPRYCTMRASTEYCAIPHAKGSGIKWPKLQELYIKLFKVEFDGAHDALADVKACAACFFVLVQIKVLNVAEWEPVA